MFVIYLKGKRVKTYPYKIQCIIWAFGHGYVYRSSKARWIDPCIKIKKMK